MSCPINFASGEHVAPEAASETAGCETDCEIGSAVVGIAVGAGFATIALVPVSAVGG